MKYDDHKKYLLPRYHQRMAAMRQHLGGSCVMCGSTERLEIDHIDPLTKSFDLSKKWGTKWEILLEELTKCQLLCFDCHRLQKSAEESKIRNKGVKPWNAGTSLHGTHRMRYVHKCKCDECQDFHIRRMASHRQNS